MSEQKYYVVPVIEGQSTFIPLFPEAVTLDNALQQITQRLGAIKAMGKDYWRDDFARQIPLAYVGFHIITETEYNENNS